MNADKEVDISGTVGDLHPRSQRRILLILFRYRHNAGYALSLQQSFQPVRHVTIKFIFSQTFVRASLSSGGHTMSRIDAHHQFAVGIRIIVRRRVIISCIIRRVVRFIGRLVHCGTRLCKSQDHRLAVSRIGKLRRRFRFQITYDSDGAAGHAGAHF